MVNNGRKTNKKDERERESEISMNRKNLLLSSKEIIHYTKLYIDHRID